MCQSNVVLPYKWGQLIKNFILLFRWRSPVTWCWWNLYFLKNLNIKYLTAYYLVATHSCLFLFTVWRWILRVDVGFDCNSSWAMHIFLPWNIPFGFQLMMMYKIVTTCHDITTPFYNISSQRACLEGVYLFQLMVACNII